MIQVVSAHKVSKKPDCIFSYNPLHWLLIDTALAPTSRHWSGMSTIAGIHKHRAAMTRWRRDIHAHPEIAFEEHRTAEIVAAQLESFGIEVATGIAGTGIVGTIKKGRGNRAIGLRADLDALLIHEANDFAHASKYPSKMHACGHDGHTAMLLGAAKYLSEEAEFEGTVHLIFQPAEENEGGGRAMVDDGLFDKYPVESVFGMHNIPGMAAGTFAIKEGPMMAAFDIFNVKIIGRGGHAAMPQLTIDPIVIASKIIEAFQSIVSRFVDPQEPVVLSITQVHAGDAYNVIPGEAEIKGCTRYFKPGTLTLLEKNMRRMANEICQAYGAEVEFLYEPRYPPLVNTATEAEVAGRVASEIVGAKHVNLKPKSTMGSEDFAFMLQEKPGSYIWIGNGKSASLHNAEYDFNDAINVIGASYWVRLVEHLLPPISSMDC